MMNTQRKYRCRKCGIDMPAGPYIATELTRLRAENADLRQQLIDSGVWEER